jgi:hypothetical protein
MLDIRARSGAGCVGRRDAQFDEDPRDVMLKNTTTDGGQMRMPYQITVKSRLPAAMRGQLEALLFFNSGQHRMRHAIQATIERYGVPELIEDRGWLRVQVAGVPEVQTLYAVHEEDGRARPVGAIVFVRDSFERITVVHVGVADDYAFGGRYAGERVLPRLLQQIRQVARRTSGIRHVEVAYSRNRLRAATA